MKKMDKKILVVDDNQDIVTTLSMVLEKQGYIVDKAYNGNECLEKTKENDIKLVFLDIMMPGLDGYAVAKELRKMYQKRIRIVYVSIKPKAEVNLEHVDGFIQKPFSLNEILLEAKKIA